MFSAGKVVEFAKLGARLKSSLADFGSHKYKELMGSSLQLIDKARVLNRYITPPSDRCALPDFVKKETLAPFTGLACLLLHPDLPCLWQLSASPMRHSNRLAFIHVRLPQQAATCFSKCGNAHAISKWIQSILYNGERLIGRAYVRGSRISADQSPM